ncbi:MAG TPA: PIG-L family deacetylase [Micromonosporaceae bacterium]|nr:PIG-L family deacetylase [Micromonosporaceae bacterium]
MRRRALLAALAAAPLTAGRLTMAAPLPPALFVAAHPDDELLSMGVAIAEHVAFGRDVHVLWLTDGGTTSARNAINGTTTSSWWGVPHDPAAEGYAPLTVQDCAAARIREATNSVRLLATGHPAPITVHRAQLQDGAYTQFAAEAAIAAVADLIAPGAPVHLKTHSWLVDNHPDHLAAGGAAKALNTADPSRYPAVRYYVQSTYWADARLAQVADTFDLPTDAGITARVRAACRAYGAWAPAQGVYAVGMHSVSGLFNTLVADPKCKVHP